MLRNQRFDLGWLLGAWIAAATFFAMPFAGSVRADVGSDPRADAKSHFEAGMRLLEKDNFEGAAIEFGLSVDIFPTSSAMINLANAYYALDRYSEALQIIGRLRSEFGNDLGKEMLSATDRLETKIRDLVGELEFDVKPPGAEVFLNGNLIGAAPLASPVLLAPGRHVIDVKAPKRSTETRTVTIASRQKERLVFDLRPAHGTVTLRLNVDGATVLLDSEELGRTPLSAPVELVVGEHRFAARKTNYEQIERTLVVSENEAVTLDLAMMPVAPGSAGPTKDPVTTRWGWITLISGGVMIIGGAATGITALSLDADIKKYCRGGVCLPEMYDDLETRDSLAIATDVLLATGVAVAATGVLLLTVLNRRGSRKTAPKTASSWGLRGTMLVGEF